MLLSDADSVVAMFLYADGISGRFQPLLPYSVQSSAYSTSEFTHIDGFKLNKRV